MRNSMRTNRMARGSGGRFLQRRHEIRMRRSYDGSAPPNFVVDDNGKRSRHRLSLVEQNRNRESVLARLPGRRRVIDPGALNPRADAIAARTVFDRRRYAWLERHLSLRGRDADLYLGKLLNVQSGLKPAITKTRDVASAFTRVMSSAKEARPQQGASQRQARARRRSAMGALRVLRIAVSSAAIISPLPFTQRGEARTRA